MVYMKYTLSSDFKKIFKITVNSAKQLELGTKILKMKQQTCIIQNFFPAFLVAFYAKLNECKLTPLIYDLSWLIFTQYLVFILTHFSITGTDEKYIPMFSWGQLFKAKLRLTLG